MCKIIFTFSILIFFLLNSASQEIDFNNYTSLLSCGDIPSDFTQTSQQKYLEQLKKIPKKKQTDDTKEFYRTITYAIDDILHNGKIVFGDTISKYISKVADKLLETEPELRKKLRFYTIKTSSVNSFSTHQGIIFINIGLLARLKSEAQLAFILAHEIFHYKMKHIKKNFILRKDAFKNRNRYRDDAFYANIDSMSKHSRIIEFEADSLACLFIAQTNYSLQEIVPCLELLYYDNLPVKQVKWKPQWFNQDKFIIPSCYNIKSCAPISSIENKMDIYSSHPNILRRIQQIKRIIEKVPLNNSGKEFLLHGSQFNHIKKIAIFELIRQYLLIKNFVESIYNIYVFKSEGIKSQFLDISMAKALYGLSKYKNTDEYQLAIKSFNSIEGESQAMFYFFRKLNRKQLNTLALKYVNEQIQKYPQVNILKELRYDLVKELVLINNLKVQDFYSSEQEIPEIFHKADFDISDFSSREILQKQKEYKEFYKTAFINDFKDSTFKSLFEIVQKKEHIKFLSSYERKLQYEEYIKNIMKNGCNTFAENIIILEPFFKTEIDEKSFLNEQERKNELKSCIIDAAKSASIDYSFLEIQNNETNQCHKFNQMSILKEWINEFFSYRNIDFVLLSSDLFNTKNEINSDYICFIGVFTDKRRYDLYTFFMNIKTGKPIFWCSRENQTGKKTKKELEKYFYSITN